MSACDDIEKFGKGIGNASRYALVEELLKGPKTVGELVSAVKQSQPAVSQHLKTLKETGLVSDKRDGQSIIYSLNTEHMLKLLTALSKDVERCPSVTLLRKKMRFKPGKNTMRRLQKFTKNTGKAPDKKKSPND